MTESRKSRATGTRKSDPQATMAEAMSEFQRMGLASLNWMGTGWLEKMSDMSSEWLEFMAARVREDAKFQHKILHCKDTSEMQHVQAEFIQTAIDQYTAETGKIVEMNADLWKPPVPGSES